MSDEPEALPSPIVGRRFSDALTYAVELHSRQTRKGTAIPYITHLFTVWSLVLEDGGDEDQAIAALLHDGPEDQGGQLTLDEIRRRFGDEVAALVDGLTDTLLDPKPPWRPRKEAYLARLEDEPDAVLRISLADKLHNLRSMAIDHAAVGEDVWRRFHADRDQQAWYFRALLDVFSERLPSRAICPSPGDLSKTYSVADLHADEVGGGGSTRIRAGKGAEPTVGNLPQRRLAREAAG